MDVGRGAAALFRSNSSLVGLLATTTTRWAARPQLLQPLQRQFGTSPRRCGDAPNPDGTGAEPQASSPSSLGWNSAGLGGNRPSGAAASNPTAASTGGMDLSRMMTPSAVTGNVDASALMRDLNMSMVPPVPDKPPLRLKPALGRSLRIYPGSDITRSFMMLDLLCNKNRIKADHNKQRFHERPGLKRKRLKSQRWRRRFSQGFRTTVSRVKQLKKQGW